MEAKDAVKKAFGRLKDNVTLIIVILAIFMIEGKIGVLKNVLLKILQAFFFIKMFLRKSLLKKVNLMYFLQLIEKIFIMFLKLHQILYIPIQGFVLLIIWMKYI
jgi:hypothetical protein